MKYELYVLTNNFHKTRCPYGTSELLPRLQSPSMDVTYPQSSCTCFSLILSY